MELLPLVGESVECPVLLACQLLRWEEDRSAESAKLEARNSVESHPLVPLVVPRPSTEAESVGAWTMVIRLREESEPLARLESASQALAGSLLCRAEKTRRVLVATSWDS